MQTPKAPEVLPSKSRQFPPWERDSLPDPPVQRGRRWTSIIGPGLVMVGANIGGGEWLFGPLVTAQYGGQVLWLATLAILMQVAYNLSVMRYTLYTGESIFVGLFRLPPGLPFWPMFYVLFEIGGVWPYLSANAAVPLASVILGRLPTAADASLVKGLGYVIFLFAFLPLIFGGKVYTALERVMTAKLVLVLGYLGFVTLFFVSWDTWVEIGSGFFKFGLLPEGEMNWARLAAFTAVAGAGGLTNSAFSGYARDKGWGMGARAGAIPSAVGGRTIQLSHTGKVFDLTPQNLSLWRRWLCVIQRDQFLLWLPGCILGMALPAMFSYEYLRGSVASVDGNAVAAMTADALARRHGSIFWFATLLCGFLIMAPTQVSQLDQIARRWTDVIWIGSRRLREVDAHKVKLVYYTLLALYCIWGLIALRVTPNPLVLAIASGVMWNFAFAFTSLHLLWVMLRLMPAPLRPGWLQCAGLIGGAILYAGISGIAFAQQWSAIKGWFVAQAQASASSPIAIGAKPTNLGLVGAGEGPAWSPSGGLYFTGSNRIMRRDMDGSIHAFRDPSGGANGLLFDPEGGLIACEAGNRRVTRTEKDGSITVLADRYEGHRFNQPNDLTIDSKGRIYFTDPRYGRRDDMEMRDAEGKLVEGVYRIDAPGKVARIITHEADRPNGILVSPRDELLYVADNNNNHKGAARKLWRFRLKPDGTVDPASRKLMFDWEDGRGLDGIKMDTKGRLFVAAGLNKPHPPFETAEKFRGGVYVLSPEGKLLEFIPIPVDEVTNCAFGGPDLKTLFITAGGTLWSIGVDAPGRVSYEKP